MHYKSVLGAGLMSPRTIMNVLALNLYARYNRIESDISKITKINEEKAQLHYEYIAGVIEIDAE